MKFKGTVKLDLEGFTKIRKYLHETGNMNVEVGVLSNKTERGDGEDFDNAAIGATHELGSIEANIPPRSFLKVPAITVLPKRINKISAARIMKNLMAKGTVATLREIGQIAEGVIDEGFATRGFGKWAPNKPATIRKKKGKDMPLIDSGKLRRSITSRVVKKESSK